MKLENSFATSLNTVLLLLFSNAQCQASDSAYRPLGASCVDYTIPVSPNASGAIFNEASKWLDDCGLSQFTANRGGRDPLASPVFSAGSQQLNGSFTIGATFCTPTNPQNNHSKTVILASHGLGFDRSYWNIAFDPEKYNFAQFAINQGYSIFFYDRLGVGQSSKMSGFTNQFSLQQSILSELIALIKSGRYTSKLGVPNATVLIGHSFGSVLSHGIATTTPDAVDAIILTGYSNNATLLEVPIIISAWQPRMANLARKEWVTLDAGYVTWVDLFSNINTFFKIPGYTLPAAEYSEYYKQPFGIAEALTASPALFPSTTFEGAVLVISGTNDFLFCNGYCEGVLETSAQAVFTESKNLKTYLQPDTGHGMNFHYNATGYYRFVTDFLNENGL